MSSGANPKGGLILMGGGTDTDDAFKQLIKWSDAGNILIIRAYGVWDIWNRMSPMYFLPSEHANIDLIVFVHPG